jgi:hypothetical protein
VAVVVEAAGSITAVLVPAVAVRGVLVFLVKAQMALVAAVMEVLVAAALAAVTAKLAVMCLADATAGAQTARVVVVYDIETTSL